MSRDMYSETLQLQTRRKVNSCRDIHSFAKSQITIPHSVQAKMCTVLTLNKTHHFIIDEPKPILGRYGKAVCLCGSVYTGSESTDVHEQTPYTLEAHGTIITCACMLTMLNSEQGKQDGRNMWTRPNMVWCL